jgi:hypothetical protein
MKQKNQLELFDGKHETYKQNLKDIIDQANKNRNRFPKSLLAIGYCLGLTRAMSILEQTYKEKI